MTSLPLLGLSPEPPPTLKSATPLRAILEKKCISPHLISCLLCKQDGGSHGQITLKIAYTPLPDKSPDITVTDKIQDKEDTPGKSKNLILTLAALWLLLTSFSRDNKTRFHSLSHL
jgi:hypothetical protein